MLCNSGCIYSDYEDVRYMVYRWGFPCLDYSFDVLISWSYKRSLYRWFWRIRFHRILLQISDFIIIIIILHSLHPALPLVFYFTSLLILSYYIKHVPCLISFTISLSALVCPCSRYDFQYMLFLFRFIDTRVLIPVRHLAFTILLVGEFWFPWIVMSKSWSLDLWILRLLIRDRSESVDHR